MTWPSSWPSDELESIIDSDSMVNTDWTIECADFGLENQRIARHVVKGQLGTGERCFDGKEEDVTPVADWIAKQQRYAIWKAEEKKRQLQLEAQRQVAEYAKRRAVLAEPDTPDIAPYGHLKTRRTPDGIEWTYNEEGGYWRA